MTVVHIDPMAGVAVDQLLVRPEATCPVCHAQHCLTRDGRLWTHGPRRARCRGSQRTIPGARWAARTVRGIDTLYLPGDGPGRHPPPPDPAHTTDRPGSR